MLRYCVGGIIMTGEHLRHDMRKALREIAMLETKWTVEMFVSNETV